MFATVLSGDAQAALGLLAKSGLVKDAYLAGGSALALHFGHRYSIDFDFFTALIFDPKELSSSLSKLGIFHEDFAKGISLIGTFNDVKMSYFQYDYPMLEKTLTYSGVAVAHYKDIAAMKLVAICDRSTKKDFIDLYELINQGNTLEELLEWYDKKFHKLKSNAFSIIRSLTYFDEAEEEAMPQMIRPIAWKDVKHFFVSESIRLAKSYFHE